MTSFETVAQSQVFQVTPAVAGEGDGQVGQVLRVQWQEPDGARPRGEPSEETFGVYARRE